MAPNRYYSSNAQPTTLAASLPSVSSGTTGQAVEVQSVAGYPTQYPFTLLLEWGTASQEIVTVTQAATGVGPYTFANCTRGDDGTLAAAHTSGAAVVHGVSARDFSDAQTALAAALASLPALTQASVSASAALALDTITTVTAATALTMTLPAPVAGALIVVERESASAASVAVTGNIRGVGSSTVTLQLASESEMFYGYGGSWWPIGGHKTLASLQALFDTAGLAAAETTRAQAAEALLAPLASPAFTGSPTAPTQTTGDNSTKVATTAFTGTAAANALTAAQTYAATQAATAQANAIAASDPSGSASAAAAYFLRIFAV